MKNDSSETTGMLSVKDVSRLLNIHGDTVRRWSDLGILATFRTGRRGDRKFKAEDIFALIVEEYHKP